MELLTPDTFAQQFPVSRETMDRLVCVSDLLVQWNAKINLVSASTIPDLWRRHILDSAQLVPFVPHDAKTLVDIGSGAGFPALILAILTDIDVHAVESDSRKCAFMREAARKTGCSITVNNTRIEKIQDLQADIVSARALASLEKLLNYAQPILKPSGIGLFLKGISLQTELTAAKKIWHIESTQHPSLSDPSSWILRVEAFARVDQRSSRS